MLAEDATFTMPPLRTWYRGRDAIAVFLVRFALSDRRRLVPARANGQLAFGVYAWEAEKGSYTAFSLQLLTLEGTQATDVTLLCDAGHARPRSRAIRRFQRFGLPDRLD